MDNDITFENVLLRPIIDGDYYESVLRAIRSSQHICYCSLFIVDYHLEEDRDLIVDTLLTEMSNADWRGVDTRLIIGGSRTNQQILDATLLAWARAKELGINVRLAAVAKNNNSHVKLAIIDDIVITGSHNWSEGMFGEQTQDSVLLRGTDLAVHLIDYFENHWKKIPIDGYDVSI
ncbi:MAG: phospholipase D-like domain-containing protein [Saonia sp.]